MCISTLDDLCQESSLTPIVTRHRAKRAKLTIGCTAEQNDFEVGQLQQDRSISRSEGTRKDRAKKEHAFAKSFAIRGFKGKGFLESYGVERQERMKKAARRERVQSGSEGNSVTLRHFLQDEGLLHPASHTHPWLRKTGMKKCILSSSSAEFDLSSAVALFRRTSILPNVPIETVQSADRSNVNGRALKRMISAMLLSSGVEPNPGPTEKCIYDNNGETRIAGYYPLVTKKLSCPNCGVQLEDISELDNGKTGLHPRTLAPVDSEPSAPLVEEEISAKEIARQDRAASSRKPDESCSSSTPVPVTPVPVCIVPAPKPPMDPEEVGSLWLPKVEKEFPLDGCNITKYDRRDLMSEIVGRRVRSHEISVTDQIITFQGEQRLVTSLNVLPIKRDFRACQLAVYAKKSYVWPLLVYTSFLVALSYHFICSTLYDTEEGLYYAFPLSVLSMGAMWFESRLKERPFFLSYIPHIVSCVMNDYDRNTSPAAAIATLNLKWRRLSSFPLIDADIDKFHEGTERVVLQLLGKRDFFWEGAACFKRPQ
jgi:hypothetical protein